MSNAFTYPAADVAVPEVQRLIGMLTGATPKNLTQALKSGWTVQGYVQGLVVGEPSDVSSLSVDLTSFQGELSDAEAVETLKKLADQGPTAQGLLDGFGGKMALKLLLPVLQKWLVNWLTNGGLEDLIGRIGGSSTSATPAPAAG